MDILDAILDAKTSKMECDTVGIWLPNNLNYGIKDESIKRVEQIMFGNVWLGSRSEKERGVDRIKRSVLKNDYGEGGLNITDVDCLNKALKLRQYTV